MRKILVTLSNHCATWLAESTKNGRKSFYVDGLIARHWKNIDTAWTLIAVSGLKTVDILPALDLDYSSLPAIGCRSRVMARLLLDIGHTLDGDESLCWAISLICEDIQQGNHALLKRLENE